MASSPTPGTRSAFLNTATQCSGFKLFVQCVELSLLDDCVSINSTICVEAVLLSLASLFVAELYGFD
ncbi:hypothetical protein CMV_017076 [Castanea mollissima]|uniref:Uncharacterized protein n=1 Tax=Castanea mollissima TaxID=60419 RepID=A0A8J4R734_9ROSI|nr:hypothetical protein CMV_017076 [Castanea mollissima]